MNQSKFSLADVLTVLAALVFGFVSFLGANFLNIGNDSVWGMPNATGCVVIAVFVTLSLFGTAFVAKLLKRTSRNFKTCFVWEVILLFLFVLSAVFFASEGSPFAHYFTVTEQKLEINGKLQASITQAENMFAEYENYADNREELYKQKLQSVVAAKGINPTEYARYGFDGASGVSDASQIDTKMFTIHADLFPTNYSDTIAGNGIKEIATEWLQEAKNTTGSWKPIGIVDVVNDIEQNSTAWLNTLVTLSKAPKQDEPAPDFEYNLSFDDVKTHFTKFESPSPLSIGLAVLAYALMLLSWFVTKRNTKSNHGFHALIRKLFSPKREKKGSGFDIEY
jgi:hypothetical protein